MAPPPPPAAEPLPYRPAPPRRPARKNTSFIALAGAAATVVSVLFAAGVFGGGDDSPSTGTPGGNPLSNAAGSPSGNPGASSGGTVVPSGQRVAAIPSPVPRNAPPPAGADTVIDSSSNNEAAAAAISDALRRSGLNMAGIGVYVFPMKKAEGSLLVIDAPDTAPAFSATQAAGPDEKAFAQALLSAPAGANITRLAMNIRSRDAQGPYILTMTMPMTALQGIANGTTTSLTLGEVQLGVRR
jgi:hypothetical protein